MQSSIAALPRLRIVIVDPDVGRRRILKESLQEDLRHDVIGEAASGTSMVRTVLTLEPDVVVFNVHLPHLNGLEALRQINESRPTAGVAFGSDQRPDLIRQALDSPVEAFLAEPVEPRQLAPALYIAWARSREKQRLREENAEIQLALKNRKLVERAKGVLMKRHRWSEDQAFRRLQRSAMNQRRPLADLAQAILNGQEVELVDLDAPAHCYVTAGAVSSVG